MTIIKDEWDSVALDRVKEACDVTKKAEIGAVVLHEGNFSKDNVNDRTSECLFINRTHDNSKTADRS